MALPSTDPSDIANAARCFSSCISDPLSVRAYLLDQVSIIAAPPCVTPTAPTLAGLVNGGGDPAFSGDLQASWKQLSNSGTLIIGYIVSWGTTNGGPYTSNSGLLPVTPKTYLITGLNPGTTYYAVVQAVGSVSGCNSVNSNQLSNVPTGGPCTAGTTFANTWAANVVANGGAAPSDATKQVVATLQCGMIAAGLDTKMITWNLLVNDSFTAAKVPQLPGDDSNTLWTFNNFIAGDLSINGLAGNGTTKFVNPGIPIGFARSAQNIGIFVYTSVTAATVNGRACGDINSIGGTPGMLIGTHDNTANSFGLNGANAGNLITTPTHNAGFYSDQRVSATDHRLFYGSSGSPLAQIGATDAVNYAGGFSDSGPYFFAVNQGGAPILFTGETLSAAGITTGLTTADVTNLFNLFQAARVSLGGGFA